MLKGKPGFFQTRISSFLFILNGSLGKEVKTEKGRQGTAYCRPERYILKG
jgi:hypothetical protein